MKSKSKAAAREAAEPRKMTKRQPPRHEREERLRRILLLGIGASLVLVVAVLFVGYYREVLRKGDQPIAAVHGRPISSGLFANYLGYQVVLLNREVDRIAELSTKGDEKSEERQMAQFQLQILQQRGQGIESEALQQLVDGEIIREEAARLGLSATQEELDNALLHELAEYPIFGEAAVGAIEPFTGTLTIDEARQQLGGILGRGRFLTEAEHRHLVLEMAVLRAKVEATVSGEVKSSQEQVRARQIRVDTEEEANKVKERLAAGEEFAAVATEVSKDSVTKDNGGDLGWFPRGIVDLAVESAVFGMKPSEVSGPIKGVQGFFVVRVEERADDRPLSEEHLRRLRRQHFNEWMGSKRTDQVGDIEYFYSADKLDWVREYVTREISRE